MIPGRRRIPFLFISCLLVFVQLHAQEVQIDQIQSGHSVDSVLHPRTLSTSTPSQPKLWLVAGSHIGLWTGSFIALNKAWYKNFDKSHFHFFNDGREWLQMDKAGHAWTAYQLSRMSASSWYWAGLDHKKSAWLGSLSAMAYQGVIEIHDGYSTAWGFSWWDMAANVAGAATFLSQELGWQEQRIQIKLGFKAYDYSTQSLRSRRDQIFGKPLPDQLLKDYNLQNYWVSFNISSFIPESNIPRWLNLAAGYNARGMLGGENNLWTDWNGHQHDYSCLQRTRHFMLSPDIDLTKIRTKKKWLRSVFFVANMIKIPAPTLELSNKGNFSAHLLYW